MSLSYIFFTIYNTFLPFEHIRLDNDNSNKFVIAGDIRMFCVNNNQKTLPYESFIHVQRLNIIHH